MTAVRDFPSTRPTSATNIGSADGSDDNTITFSSFDTEKYRDQVNFYEGWNGKGALIAVLHGEYSSKDNGDSHQRIRSYSNLTNKLRRKGLKSRMSSLPPQFDI